MGYENRAMDKSCRLYRQQQMADVLARRVALVLEMSPFRGRLLRLRPLLNNLKARDETHLQDPPGHKRRSSPQPSWEALARSLELSLNHRLLYVLPTAATHFLCNQRVLAKISLPQDCPVHPPSRYHNQPIHPPRHPSTLGRNKDLKLGQGWIVACKTHLLYPKQSRNTAKTIRTLLHSHLHRMAQSTLTLGAVSEALALAQALQVALTRSLR